MRRFDNMTLNVDDFDKEYLSVNTDLLETFDNHHLVHTIQQFSDRDFTLTDLFSEMTLDEEKKAFIYRVLQEAFSRMDEYSKAIVDEALGRTEMPEVLSNKS